MNLNYADGVIKTPAIARCVELIDPFFEGEQSVITSGFRSVNKQLSIIIQKARTHNIYTEFPEFVSLLGRDPDVKEIITGYDSPIFYWQRTWSKLLSIGDIVNPPLPAEVLFDYCRPGSTENKKGQIVQISPHQRGLAFDIAGDANLTEKAKRIMKAQQSGSCFITDFLVEHVNRAVHIGVQQIG